MKLFSTSKIQLARWPGNARMALSFSFDDVEHSHYKEIAPLLEQYGVKGTFYINPGLLDADSLSGYRKLLEAGHEIGNHTHDHLLLKGLDTNQVRHQISEGDRALRELFGAEPTSFCHPHNKTSPSIDQQVFEWYDVSRVSSKVKSTRYYNDIRSYTPLNLLDECFLKAYKNKGWWHIAGHGLQGSGWEPVSRSFLLEALVRYLLPDVFVGTVSEAGVAELLGHSVQLKGSWKPEQAQFSFAFASRYAVFQKMPKLPVTVLVEAPTEGMWQVNPAPLSTRYCPLKRRYAITVDLNSGMEYELTRDLPWFKKMKN